LDENSVCAKFAQAEYKGNALDTGELYIERRLLLKKYRGNVE
jgi:hypothetical protein